MLAADELGVGLRLRVLQVAPAGPTVVQKQLMQRLGFILGDRNLKEDPAVARIVQQHLGVIPAAALLAVPRIGELTEDAGDVLEAARASTGFSVVDEASITRCKPFPRNMVDGMGNQVVVENLPSTDAAAVQALMSSVGKVTDVAVHESGGGAPFAVVTYADLMHAATAVRTLNDAGNWRSGLRVAAASRRLPGLMAAPAPAPPAATPEAAVETAAPKPVAPGVGVVAKLSHTFGYIQPGDRAATELSSRKRDTNSMLLFEMKDVDCGRHLRVGDVVTFVKSRDAHTERPVALRVALKDDGGTERAPDAPRRRPPPRRTAYGGRVVIQALGPDGTRGFTRPRNAS